MTASLQLSAAQAGFGGGGLACCERVGTYNGFNSDGPRRFTCPKGCACHD